MFNVRCGQNLRSWKFVSKQIIYCMCSISIVYFSVNMKRNYIFFNNDDRVSDCVLIELSQLPMQVSPSTCIMMLLTITFEIQGQLKYA